MGSGSVRRQGVEPEPAESGDAFPFVVRPGPKKCADRCVCRPRTSGRHASCVLVSSKASTTAGEANPEKMMTRDSPRATTHSSQPEKREPAQAIGVRPTSVDRRNPLGTERQPAWEGGSRRSTRSRAVSYASSSPWRSRAMRSGTSSAASRKVPMQTLLRQSERTTTCRSGCQVARSERPSPRRSAKTVPGRGARCMAMCHCGPDQKDPPEPARSTAQMRTLHGSLSTAPARAVAGRRRLIDEEAAHGFQRDHPSPPCHEAEQRGVRPDPRRSTRVKRSPWDWRRIHSATRSEMPSPCQDDVRSRPVTDRRADLNRVSSVARWRRNEWDEGTKSPRQDALATGDGGDAPSARYEVLCP